MTQLTNIDEFIAWRDMRTKQIDRRVAVRAALRSYPFALASITQHSLDHGRQKLALVSGRAMLTTVTACNIQIDNTTISSSYTALLTARSAFSGTKTAHNSAAISASFAIETIFSTTTEPSPDDSISATAHAAFLSVAPLIHSENTAISAINAAIYDTENIELNTDIDLISTPLWEQKQFTGTFKENWNTFQTKILPKHPEFAFWHDWYQGFLDGKPIDWGLQRAVVLIPDADWDKGPAHIAEMIEDIRKKYDRKPSTQASLEDQLKSVSAKAKSTISQNITLNRDALAVSIDGLNEQLAAFREKVRGLNHLDPDFRVELLDYLKGLSEHLTCLLRGLPKTNDPISDKQAGKFVLWLREFKPLITQKSRAYISPDNVSDAVIPTGIILGCTGIGSMLGMPLAGAAVGGLITGQIKPGKAASDLFKSDKPDTGEE